MLRSTFCLLPRVGLVTESRLWAAGCRTWDDYRAGPPRLVRGMGAELRARHDVVLRQAEAALEDDPSFFAREVPSAEHWRAWGDLARDAAFFDIETDGTRSGSAVTVLGVRRRGRTRTLVAGDDLTRESAGEALAGATMLVSFAGASFDVPVLRDAGVEVPRVPHFDLLPAFRRLGRRGGLKRIEAELGLAREEGVEGLSGRDAITLWHRHRAGDAGALETLLAYNRADVDNLETLARIAYDGLASQVTFGVHVRLA